MTGGVLFMCHQTTVSRNLPHVLKLIASMGNQRGMIKMPRTNNEIKQAKAQFFKIGGFPAVIGAIGMFEN